MLKMITDNADHLPIDSRANGDSSFENIQARGAGDSLIITIDVL